MSHAEKESRKEEDSTQAEAQTKGDSHNEVVFLSLAPSDTGSDRAVSEVAQ